MNSSPTATCDMLYASQRFQHGSLCMPNQAQQPSLNPLLGKGGAPMGKGRLSVPVSPAATPLSLMNENGPPSAAMANFNRPTPPLASPPPPSPDYPNMFLYSGANSAGNSPALMSAFGAGSPLASSFDFFAAQSRQLYASSLGRSPNLSRGGLCLYSQESGLLMPSRSNSSVLSNNNSQQPSNTLRQRIMKTKLCVHHLHGRCARGLNCAFAHSVNELRRPPNLYKTRLCINFSNNGCCPKGDLCRFAHGDLELRAGEQQADEYARMAALRAAGGSSSPRLGSPSLFNSTTPASVLSPATPHPRCDNVNMSRSATDNCDERLLEADAIDVLLKLPEETRQQLVDLVIRTVAATQGFEKNTRGSTNHQWRRPAHAVDSARRVSTSSTSSSVRPRSSSAISLANTACGKELFVSPAANMADDFYPPQGLGATSSVNGADSLFGTYEQHDSMTIDPFSAAMFLYGKMPLLPPLPPAAMGVYEEDGNGPWGAELERLPQLNVVTSPRSNPCKTEAFTADVPTDETHDCIDSLSNSRSSNRRSGSKSPLSSGEEPQEHYKSEDSNCFDSNCFDSYISRQQKDQSRPYSLFAPIPVANKSDMTGDENNSVEDFIRRLTLKNL